MLGKTIILIFISLIGILIYFQIAEMNSETSEDTGSTEVIITTTIAYETEGDEPDRIKATKTESSNIVNIMARHFKINKTDIQKALIFVHKDLLEPDGFFIRVQQKQLLIEEFPINGEMTYYVNTGYSTVVPIIDDYEEDKELTQPDNSY